MIARNTAFSFKGKNVDAREIGKELGVRYVLEGSVQRDPGRVRVNVQLIDAKTGNHLWADRFDKPLVDLFEMQDEIVARLANQLGAELTSAEAARAQQAPNPNSMDLFFQGLASLNKEVNVENMARARGFFERALTLDPGNLDALLEIGRVDYSVGGAYLSDDRDARLAAAEAAIAKVLSQRPNDALAHEIMGGILNQTNRSEQGIAELERALTLDPNLATAHGDSVSPRFWWVASRKPKLMKKRPCASRRATVSPGSGCISRAPRRWLLAPTRRRSHCFAAPSRSTGPAR